MLKAIKITKESFFKGRVVLKQCKADSKAVLEETDVPVCASCTKAITEGNASVFPS